MGSVTRRITAYRTGPERCFAPGREGRYGFTKTVPRAGKPETHVSTKGLMLASGRLITDAQIAAARVNPID